MPDTDVARQGLLDLVQGCRACYKLYCDNVATITDDYGNLSDEQVPILLELMKEVHQHQHVH